MRVQARVVVAVVVTAGSLFGFDAGAQAFAPVAANYRTALTPEREIQDRAGGEPSADLPTRLILGLVGSVVGVYAGATIGMQSAAGCHGEFCALVPAITGAAAGATLISAIAASLPDNSSKCGRGKRVAAALLGSGTGLFVGGEGGRVAGPLGVATGAFVGTTIGSAIGAELCR